MIKFKPTKQTDGACEVVGCTRLSVTSVVVVTTNDTDVEYNVCKAHYALYLREEDDNVAI